MRKKLVHDIRTYISLNKNRVTVTETIQYLHNKDPERYPKSQESQYFRKIVMDTLVNFLNYGFLKMIIEPVYSSDGMLLRDRERKLFYRPNYPPKRILKFTKDELKLLVETHYIEENPLHVLIWKELQTINYVTFEPLDEWNKIILNSMIKFLIHDSIISNKHGINTIIINIYGDREFLSIEDKIQTILRDIRTELSNIFTKISKSQD